jgi:hypothetical protein
MHVQGMRSEDSAILSAIRDLFATLFSCPTPPLPSVALSGLFALECAVGTSHALIPLVEQAMRSLFEGQDLLVTPPSTLLAILRDIRNIASFPPPSYTNLIQSFKMSLRSHVLASADGATAETPESITISAMVPYGDLLRFVRLARWMLHSFFKNHAVLFVGLSKSISLHYHC